MIAEHRQLVEIVAIGAAKEHHIEWPELRLQIISNLEQVQ